MVITDSRTL